MKPVEIISMGPSFAFLDQLESKGGCQLLFLILINEVCYTLFSIN